VPVDDLRVRDVERFVANFEDMAMGLRPGEPAPETAVEGIDASGTVHCLVTLGGVVSQVNIMDGWWEPVGPRGIAASVLDAWRFAREKAGWGRLILHRAGHPYDPDAPRLEPEVPLPAYDSPDYLAAVERKLQRTAAVLGEIRQLTRARDSTEQRVVAGPRRMFEVVLEGLQVVGARVNEYGLRAEDAADLADDARAALLAARSLTLS
jgi:hypothetical protein